MRYVVHLASAVSSTRSTLLVADLLCVDGGLLSVHHRRDLESDLRLLISLSEEFLYDSHGPLSCERERLRRIAEVRHVARHVEEQTTILLVRRREPRAVTALVLHARLELEHGLHVRAHVGVEDGREECAAELDAIILGEGGEEVMLRLLEETPTRGGVVRLQHRRVVVQKREAMARRDVKGVVELQTEERAGEE